MNSNKLFSLLLLSILFCSAIPFSAGPVFSEAASSLTPKVLESSVTTPSPEPPHRILPVSILVYSQFADNRPGEEVENMFAAINSTYGTDYHWTNLTDYTNLAAELPNHDILLIPEQENAYYANMTTVGAAWSTTLTNWVNDGGIVICTDGRSMPEMNYGSSNLIYNESGLMKTYGASSAYPITIYLVNTSDALARGVSGSWTSSSMTISYDSPEETVVVDDGTDPIVIHKVLGKGHVVLIGFDYYSSDADMEMILSNSICLHRHVVFDNSHGQYDNILGGFSTYADDLVTEGFAVSSMSSFSPAFFAACDVLVIPASGIAYSAGEITAIKDFVAAGGGLFLVQDWSYWDPYVEPIANEFGYVRTASSWLNDTDDCPLQFGAVEYSGANIHNHSLTLDVAQVENYWGGGFSAMPAEAQSIIVTDTDGTATWNDTGSAADGVTCFAVSTYYSGRVAVTLDFNWLLDDQDGDGDLSYDYYDSDNYVLAANTIRWLSAAGLKERIILFDESHNPISGINGGYLLLGKYLTSNGYTVRWMSTFHTSLLDEAHVLFICDGTVAYSNPEINAIEAFVSAGGGLFLITDFETAGDRTDPIGNQFGIDRNDTSYLEDSDDSVGGNPSFIFFNGANIGVHPITQGVSRIEVYTTTAFDTIGSGTALVSSDIDGTCSWHDGGGAIGLPIMAAVEHGLGRVVCVCDLNFLDVSDWDSDGVSSLLEHDNNLFAVNAFQWLVENRAPVVEVTYPNGAETLTGTVSVSWSAIDPNKDPITSYDVYYSDNNGGSWTNLATGLTTTSTNWDTTAVSDGDQYLIRVVAHDYELNGQDQSDAVFSIDNVTPTPTPPPIPGFPFEAVALGLLFSLGLIFVMRRRRRHEVHH